LSPNELKDLMQSSEQVSYDDQN